MKIYQNKISKNHNDSYWYKGLIAETKTHELLANGEVKLNCDCKPQNDKELVNCYENDHFSLNNWFEIFDKQSTNEGFVCGGNYDEALKELKERETNEKTIND